MSKRTYIQEYIPDLEYFFNKFVDTYYKLTIGQQIRSSSSSLTQWEVYPGSFFELLFSNVFSYDSYLYLFLNVSPKHFATKGIRERLHSIDPDGLNCWVIDPAGVVNLFNIGDEEKSLLDLILIYRHGEIPDLSIIDYSNLNSILSKLMYQYLDIVINYNFENLNTTSLLSNTDNFLETFYETYVTNEAHRLMINWNFLIDTGLVSLRPCRNKTIITQDIITQNYITLVKEPYDNWLMVFKNGDIQDSSLFMLIVSNGVTTFTWSDTFTMEVGDTLIIDYRTKSIPAQQGDTPFDTIIDYGDIAGE